MNSPRKLDPREALDAAKRGKVLALLSLGCSRRMAAEKVGCGHSAIGRAAARDPLFAAEVDEAERGRDGELQKLLRSAQHYRARRARTLSFPIAAGEPGLRRFPTPRETVDLLLGCCGLAPPRLNGGDVAEFLRILEGCLSQVGIDSFQPCPNCQGIVKVARALNMLAANILHQQDSFVPLGANAPGGA